MPEFGRRGNMVARRVVKINEATGLTDPTGEVMWWFWCPGCEEAHTYTLPGWTRTGTDEKPTFAPSLLMTEREPRPSETVVRRCHLFLREGILDFLGDCTHKLAGQKVPLPEPPDWLAE